MDKDTTTVSFTDSFDYHEMDMDRMDSGICLSNASINSDLETAMKKLSLGKVNEESECSIYEALADVPTELLFYQNDDGDTLLHMAIISNNMDYAICLINRASSPSQLDIQNYAHDQTPLHICAVTRNIPMAKLLLESGASRYLKDWDGNNPIHIACGLGCRDLVECLVSCRKGGSFENLPGIIEDMNYQGKSCLHLVFESKSNERLQILELLVCHHGADISVMEGKCGLTLLHEFVRVGDLPAIRFLLDLKIPPHLPQLKVNATSYDRSTPLDIALQMSLPDLAEALLCHGALTSSPSDFFC